jgi:hypothetical protein
MQSYHKNKNLTLLKGREKKNMRTQKEQENFFLCRKMKGHGGNKFIVKIRGKMVVLLALQVQQLPCGYSKCT